MRVADLHTHTYHSDGTRSPKEVVDVAKSHGIELLAISDHDNIAAYFEIKQYADSQHVTLIPAIELSCGYEGVDVHVLAYAFDPHDEQLAARLSMFRETRQQRGMRMVERLRALGIEIRASRVEELAAGGALGRPHVARALVEAGYVADVSAAFDKFLGTGKPAYIEKERFRIDEAVALIKRCGGVTSIAHPTLYPNWETLTAAVLDAGVDAVEAFHPEVPAKSRERLRSIARFRNKFVTGGSDDHGSVKKVETLGTVKVPEELIGPILERL
jgi:predicted metal-dependent phosphoesterase TrpH